MFDDRHGDEMDAPNPLPAEHHLSRNVLSMHVPQRLNMEMQTLGVTVRWQELCPYLSLCGYLRAWLRCCMSGEKESKCLALHPYFTKGTLIHVQTRSSWVFFYQSFIFPMFSVFH